MEAGLARLVRQPGKRDEYLLRDLAYWAVSLTTQRDLAYWAVLLSGPARLPYKQALIQSKITKKVA
jgi:hypothetical protein